MVMGTGGVITPFGAEKKTSSTADVYPVGSVMTLGDGRQARRIFSGAALTVGKVLMAPVVIPLHDADLVIAAAAVDAFKVTVTLGSTLATINQYQGGKLFFNDLEEEGHTYQIKSHPAVASGAAFVLKLDEPLVTAITATQQVGLIASPYMNVEIWDADDVDGEVVGVPGIDIADNTYGWAVTKGHQAVFMDGVIVAGFPVVASEDVDGAVVALIRDVAADAAIDNPVIGTQGQVVGVDAEYMPVKLEID